MQGKANICQVLLWFSLLFTDKWIASYRRPKGTLPNKIIAVHPRFSKKLEQTDDPMFIFCMRYQASNYTKLILYGMTRVYPDPVPLSRMPDFPTVNPTCKFFSYLSFIKMAHKKCCTLNLSCSDRIQFFLICVCRVLSKQDFHHFHTDLISDKYVVLWS